MQRGRTALHTQHQPVLFLQTLQSSTARVSHCGWLPPPCAEDGQAAHCPHTLRLHTHSSDHQVLLWMLVKQEILSLEYEPLTDIYNQSQFFISTGDTDSEKRQLNNKIIRGKTCSLTNLCTILLSVQLYTCTNQDEFISCPHHITTHYTTSVV